MEDEMLDGFLQKKEKKSNRLLGWISLVILWIRISQYGMSGVLANAEIMITIGLLSIATIATYLRYRLGFRITLGLIVLGVLNFITFSPVQYYISFGLKDLEFSVEVAMLSIGVIHCFTNWAEFSNLTKNLIHPKISDEELISIQRSKIDRFKKRFSNMSVLELDNIAGDKKRLEEAKTAAKELLVERHEI